MTNPGTVAAQDIIDTLTNRHNKLVDFFCETVTRAERLADLGRIVASEDSMRLADELYSRAMQVRSTALDFRHLIGEDTYYAMCEYFSEQEGEL